MNTTMARTGTVVDRSESMYEGSVVRRQSTWIEMPNDEFQNNFDPNSE